jgi:hypothetical protein
VIKLLEETGQVKVYPKDNDGRTLLWLDRQTQLEREAQLTQEAYYKAWDNDLYAH